MVSIVSVPALSASRVQLGWNPTSSSEGSNSELIPTVAHNFFRPGVTCFPHLVGICMFNPAMIAHL
jgi:hypothetical protein